MVVGQANVNQRDSSSEKNLRLEVFSVDSKLVPGVYTVGDNREKNVNEKDEAIGQTGQKPALSRHSPSVNLAHAYFLPSRAATLCSALSERLKQARLVDGFIAVITTLCSTPSTPYLPRNVNNRS